MVYFLQATICLTTDLSPSWWTSIWLPLSFPYGNVPAILKLRRASTFHKDTATCFRNWKDGFIVAENLLAFVGCCFPIWLVWYTYKVYIQKCFGCRHKKNLHVQGIFYHQMLNSSHSQNNRSRFVFLIFFHQIYTCISKKKNPKTTNNYI